MKDIVKEVVLDELKDVSKEDDFQRLIKESIEKVSRLYDNLHDKPLPSVNKTYLQSYWLVKLECLLEQYESRFASPVDFLCSKDLQRLTYIKNLL